jgi:hypothetical protein
MLKIFPNAEKHIHVIIIGQRRRRMAGPNESRQTPTTASAAADTHALGHNTGSTLPAAATPLRVVRRPGTAPGHVSMPHGGCPRCPTPAESAAAAAAAAAIPATADAGTVCGAKVPTPG